MDIDCLTFELALTECITGLTCPQLEQFMDAVPPYPCQAELEASCGEPGGECSVGVGQGENPGECDVTVSCQNEPEQSVECDGTSCTCYVDNVETGSCANPQAVCNDPTPDSLAACCG